MEISTTILCQVRRSTWMLLLVGLAVVSFDRPLQAAEQAPDRYRVNPLHHTDTRAAALLMSGQRGGRIEGAFVVGTPQATESGRQLPFWIELDLSWLASQSTQTRLVLEVFVYSLDELMEVDSFQGSSVDLDLAGIDEGIKLHGSIDASMAVQILRVLVREPVSGEIYLDQAAAPCQPDGIRPALVLFPDTERGWTAVPLSTPNQSGEEQGVVIAGARYHPHGRPVVPTSAESGFYLVLERPSREISSINGRLLSRAGIELQAGAIEIVDRLATGSDRLVALAARWQVPELDPGRYLLLLRLSDEPNGEVTGIEVQVAPLQEALEHVTWVACQAAPQPQPEQDQDDLLTKGPAPAGSELLTSYLNTLSLAVDQEWQQGVAGLFDLQAGVGGHSDGSNKDGNGFDTLFKLEAGVIEALVSEQPGAAIPLLRLYHDVYSRWHKAGHMLGRQHNVRLVAAICNAIRERPVLDSARPAAVAALASMADTFHDPGAPGPTTALLELTLTLDPDHQAALLGLAAAHEWVGQYQEVVGILRPLDSRSQGSSEGRLRFAINLKRIGEVREAAALLRQSTRKPAPSWVRVVAYQELVLLHLDQGRLQLAKQLIEEAIATFPDDLTLRLLHAQVEEAQGNLFEARQMLDQLALKPASVYRESPRYRYARWPAEVFAEERDRVRELAEQHAGELADAIAALPRPGGQ
jgi:tetratricopeptide (TPR) repeat protein